MRLAHGSSASNLCSKYGFFWLQKLTLPKFCTSNPGLPNDPSQTNGSRHGGLYSQLFCLTRLPGRLPFSWDPTSCLPGSTENPAGLCSPVQGPGLDTPALKSSVGVAVWMEELVLVQAAPHWSDLKLVLTSRRRLGTCPQLNTMDELQLLSLQHNRITKIQHLSHLHNLVFLNLSDNNISEMTGLEALGSLRVLMLGQNRWVRPG